MRWRKSIWQSKIISGSFNDSNYVWNMKFFSPFDKAFTRLNEQISTMTQWYHLTQAKNYISISGVYQWSHTVRSLWEFVCSILSQLATLPAPLTVMAKTYHLPLSATRCLVLLPKLNNISFLHQYSHTTWLHVMYCKAKRIRWTHTSR